MNTDIKILLEQLCGRQGEIALETLYKTYCQRLMNYLVLYTDDADTARELVSDVFLAVWNNREMILYPASFNAYIYRIAKFKAINHIKKKKMETIDLDSIPFELFRNSRTITPEDEYISRETIDKINNVIEDLPAKCKMAFKLVREDRLSYREAAEILDISVKTLDAHLCNAVKKIRAGLEE